MTAQNIDSRLLTTLEWRCIGPHRGGRVVAVAGHPTDPMTFYFGACAGGIWKTTDGGTFWENVSDGFLKTSAVGAIAVSESDPNVVYAGMGEACIRVDVSGGDGVYKSTDGGSTWANVGLKDTRHIGRVRVHPRNPDLVYVAALGHAFGPNEQRGVFRSADGGKTWERVLYRGKDAGAVDLSMDPGNPRVLYASTWEARRSPWSLVSGGPGSGLFKSTDGGDTWTELTDNPGMPEGLKGRIGIAASPARSGRVWAIVEAEDGALLRSDDGGDTWDRVSEDRDLRQRPWYYHHVFADPQDEDTVWVLNLQAWKSTDGGRSFEKVPTPHGDNHDLWIDPRNPRRMVEGNDGGACVSFNGGATWSSTYNQPTAQFYHVATDTRFPYRVYGTQQDNSAISVPSRSTTDEAVTWEDCYRVGNSESGHIAVRPDDPDIVYSGAVGSAPGGGGVLFRYDHGTGQSRLITAWPEVYYGWGAKDQKFRFQWTYPIVISPHDPSVLYVTGNRVFRTTDEGTSWEIISPDLTRNDTAKLEPSGGPITKDTSGAEHYCTIFSFAESPHERGVFWAGTDDGLVHISRDGGESWRNVTPPDLPEWATIGTIEVSPHDAATAYLAAVRYKLDDARPYLYKSNDYGKTWTTIVGGIPDNEFTRVIREDPARRGLLYAGTETQVYVSVDDGESWQSVQLNLPVVPIHDLVVKESDLVAATHGRSFWVLDDLTPLHQLTDGQGQAPARLFTPRAAYRYSSPPDGPRPAAPAGTTFLRIGGIATTFKEASRPDCRPVRSYTNAGQNPPYGAVVTYYLRERPKGEVRITFHNGQGTMLRTFSSETPVEEPDSDSPQELRVPAEAGANQFVWDLRCEGARRVPGDVTTKESVAGPVVPPGTYQVRLSLGEVEYTQPLEVLKDPRVEATQQDLEAQFALLVEIRDRLSETHDAINRLRSVRRQVGECVSRATGLPAEEAVSGAAKGIQERLGPIEEELIQARAKGALDTINFPTRLNGKLVGIAAVVANADAVPTRQSYEVFQELSSRIEEQLLGLREVIDKDVSAFAALVQELGVPAVVPKAEA